MQDYARYAERLQDILGLHRSPVAVKFIPADSPLPEEFEASPGRRYCQVLMEASGGDKALLTADNISCPAAAAALGFKPLPDKLETGEMLAAFGIFGSPAAGSNTIHSMQRLPTGVYRAVAACPLRDAPFDPDVIVIESQPEHLMWIALASVRQSGGRLNFSTAILQATCVDGTILPFLEQKLNATLGCYGCREATDLAETECLLGLPGKDLPAIISELEELAEKAMPRVRSKAVYQALAKRAMPIQ
mgnify:CR=1 FL=1